MALSDKNLLSNIFSNLSSEKTVTVKDLRDKVFPDFKKLILQQDTDRKNTSSEITVINNTIINYFDRAENDSVAYSVALGGIL